MTEDDTFNALRRTPVKKLHEFYIGWAAAGNDTGNAAMKTFLNRHGWTWGQYWEEVWDIKGQE